MAFFGDCKTREEYYNRIFGCQDVVRILEPETFSSSEKDLAWLETHSEFPIIIDFTKNASMLIIDTACYQMMNYKKAFYLR